MKALRYTGKTIELVRDHPEPALKPGEALLRVRMAGICNTDLEVLRGYADFAGTLGHEFVAMVESCGDPAWVGKRVVGEINLTCGQCAMCRRGLPSHCLERTVLGIRRRDGAFAEFLTLPVRNLHAVPESLSDQQAVFVEPLAAALEILEQVAIRPSDRVLVLGDGKLGLLVVQVLRLTGCDLTLVGHHLENLALAQGWGACTRLEGDGVPGMADVVVDCTGSPSGFALALEKVRPRGTLVLKSTYHGRVEADLSALVVNEVTVVGSRCGPFGAAIRLLQQRLVDVAPLVSRTYVLDDGEEALRHAAEPGVLKVLLAIG
ncbi:MAG: MDR/zinc-dependent alcohol dehydrogenase-like family protein [Anaerolineae bacterium]